MKTLPLPLLFSCDPCKDLFLFSSFLYMHLRAPPLLSKRMCVHCRTILFSFLKCALHSNTLTREIYGSLFEFAWKFDPCMTWIADMWLGICGDSTKIPQEWSGTFHSLDIEACARVIPSSFLLAPIPTTTTKHPRFGTNLGAEKGKEMTGEEEKKTLSFLFRLFLARGVCPFTKGFSFFSLLRFPNDDAIEFLTQFPFLLDDGGIFNVSRYWGQKS